MKKYWNLLISALCLIACSEKTVWEESPGPSPVIGVERVASREVPGISIVRFDEDFVRHLEAGSTRGESESFSSVAQALGVASVKRLFPYDSVYEERTRREGLHRWYVLEFDRELPFSKAESSLTSIPGVEVVEPQYVARTFEDPSFSKQWHFYNDGKNGLVKGVDINVKPVWENYTTGSPEVVVAVIDQGVQLDHADLIGNMIPGGPGGSINWFDEGYVIDPGDHGCHVAGIIGAMNNNGILGCGIAGGDASRGQAGVRIMSCEILREKKVGEEWQSESAPVAPAFKWAADHGAVIAQNSWGYPADQNGDGKVSDRELEAAKNFVLPLNLKEAIDYFIKYAGCDNQGNQLPDSPMKGGAVFFAAGNEGIPYGDVSKYDPVISVGAVDSEGKRTRFSNYGSWVDIAAPGQEIYSTYTQNGFGPMKGTSMACPHVSGVAALVVSYRGGKDFTNTELKECILKGANTGLVSPSEQVGPMLDALGAVTYGLADFPPSPDFQIQTFSNNVDFTWELTTSPKGIVAYSHILLATKDASLFEELTDLENLPEGLLSKEILTPKGSKGGEEMNARLTGLGFDEDYFVSMVAVGYGRVFNTSLDIVPVHTGKNHPPVLELEQEGSLKIKSHEYREVKVKVSDPDGHHVRVRTDPLEGYASIKTEGEDFLLFIDGNSFEPGRYWLQVYLEDEYGACSKESIEFEVTPNCAPIKLKEFGNLIYEGKEGKFDFLLSDYIVDPDGEDLSVSFDLSNREVLHLNYSGGKMSVTILDYGLVDVTITAKDMKDLSVCLNFKILVRPEGIQVESFPNPMTEVLYIRTGLFKRPTKVKIFSQTGSLVLSAQGESSAFEPLEVQVAHLAPGSYQVQVHYDGNTVRMYRIKK